MVAAGEVHRRHPEPPRGRDRSQCAGPDPLGVLALGHGARRALVSGRFRVAYLNGRELRVVAGDGTGDDELRHRVGTTPPRGAPVRTTSSPSRPSTGASRSSRRTRRRRSGGRSPASWRPSSSGRKTASAYSSWASARSARTTQTAASCGVSGCRSARPVSPSSARATAS